MSQTLKHTGRTSSLIMQAPPSKLPSPESVPGIDGAPRVTITGDVRLQVTEQDAARGLVLGRYHIQTERMQGPLQVIWMVEGNVWARALMRSRLHLICEEYRPEKS